MKRVSFMAIDASEQGTFKEQEKAFKESMKAFCKGSGVQLLKCGAERHKVYDDPVISLRIGMRTLIEYPASPVRLADAYERLIVAYFHLLELRGWSLAQTEP